MSEVRLRIGGRSYNVSCHDGEEAHVAHLGSMIDEKLQAMGSNRSPQESQNLLFAALFLADELHEAKKATSTSEKTLFEDPQTERQTGPALQEHAELLERVAASLEKCAETLEAKASAP